MATVTPRRSMRIPHQHTPKMSERKKGLFQSDTDAARDSMTQHREMTVVESESESDECYLGIMGTLDSSSCDENDSNSAKTPERRVWHGTRSHTKKLIKETQDLKNFIKSPFTLKKYQTRYCPDTNCGSMSTPVTPNLHNHPVTPSSTHSCASEHTTSSTSSRARKSLASLIADTESCSSSLKDLNFDTDSGADSKENTPTKSVRRSRRNKLTPKLSFKGVLVEQKKNITPMKNPVVCLTKMDITSIMSPTQMLKTPHNTSETKASPPKINRRSVLQIDESPESACDSEKSHKRLNYDNKADNGPNSKQPRLDSSAAPKARHSLFNGDRLKEILSAKSFYGKSNPELTSSVTSKLSNAIEAHNSHRRRLFTSRTHRRKRKPGQINMGVRHRIRKPKFNKAKIMAINKGNLPHNSVDVSKFNSTASSASFNNSMMSQNTSQEIDDKIDPFDKEKQTIDALLSQWTEEEEPELVPCKKPELPCFNSNVIRETKSIFEPVTAVPVSIENIPEDSEAVFIELETKKDASKDTMKILGKENVPQVQDVVMTEDHAMNHGEMPKSGQFLPVEGGYILVEENSVPVQEHLPDLDEIERELKMLDEQILKMAESNNINAGAVLASTETATPAVSLDTASTSAPGTPSSKSQKLFPIFSKPNPGTPSTPTAKGTEKPAKKFIKTGSDQYVIDAGQKKFGATQCTECGVIYEIGDPQDEHDHLVHHNASDVLKFNRMKDEVIVGQSGSSRCILVRGGSPAWRRVETLLARVVHPYLGYEGALSSHNIYEYTAYLYIDKGQIVGCLIAEPKTRAFKLIPGNPDCCSVESYPVKCGISRIWTHKRYRRRGLASRLLDCARASFLYGQAITVRDLAFSAPTEAGKALAAKYCRTDNFFVYLE